MRLREEMLQHPERMKRKLNAYQENYYALLIAILKDVTPEEAFLSLYQKRLYKLIRHTKYTTKDIYQMMAMRENRCTLKQISEAYNISVGMVWRILDVYGYGNDKKGKKNMKKEDLVKWESIKGACDTTVYEKEKKISIEFPDGRKIDISFNEAFMVADSLTTIMTDERGMLQKKLKPAFKAQI